MNTQAPHSRRYDVDWLRTLAIGLLIIYHVVLSFEPWAYLSGLPQNDEHLLGLWIPMAVINVWRIPILFLISGMGVRFAMERRDWKALLKDRTIRILVPYLFGVAVMTPLLGWILPQLGWDAEYTLQFGHLWFLLNIYLYVVWLLALLIYLKENPENALLRFFSRVIEWRFGLFLFALPLMLEAVLLRPEFYSVYVDSAHGWVLGLLCFFTGFAFISVKEVFWPAVERIRWPALAIAFPLYLVRFLVFRFENEIPWLIALESMCWMLAILGFGSLFLNKKSDRLSYLSKAVYPVYIFHLPIQFLAAYVVFPLNIPAYGKLIILLLVTFGASLFLYEYVLRRLKWIRPLFGIKLNQTKIFQ